MPEKKMDFYDILLVIDKELQGRQLKDLYNDFIPGLDDKIKRFIYEVLGIIGGAYMFLNPATKEWVYLHSRDLQSDLLSFHDKPPFIEIPFRRVYGKKSDKKPDGEEKYISAFNQKLINALFISTQQKKKVGENSHADIAFPDYDYGKNNKSDFRLEFEKSVNKKGFSMLHCVTGEVLFFIYIRQLLFHEIRMKGIDSDKGDFSKEYVSKFQFNYPFWGEIEKIRKKASIPEVSWIRSLETLGQSDRGLLEDWDDLKKEIESRRGINKGGDIDIYMDYRSLGLVSGHGKVTKSFLSLLQYLIHIAHNVLRWEMYDSEADELEFNFKENEGLNKSKVLTYLYILERRLSVRFDKLGRFSGTIKSDIEYIKRKFKIDECIQMVCRDFMYKVVMEPYLQQSKKENQETSLLLALKAFHQFSRFPVLPYFFDLVSGQNHQPREHLVIPIWSSSVSLEGDGKAAIANQAAYLFLMIRPSWDLPNDLNFNFLKDGKSVHWNKYLSEASRERLNQIKILFEKITMPAIDNMFYQSIITKKAKEAKTRSDINAFSHEMNKIIDNIFYKSNVKFKEVFGSNAKQIAQFIHERYPDEVSVEDALDWHIIPDYKKFETWSNYMKIWSGRRGRRVFDDFPRNPSLKWLIEKCEEESIKMYVAETMQRGRRPKDFKAVRLYQKHFRMFSYDNKEDKPLYVDPVVTELSEGIKMMEPNRASSVDVEDGKKNEDILCQNALIRLLIASMTNIQEHSTGKYYLNIEIKRSLTDKMDEMIEFSFYNPCFRSKEEEISESFGTKPVLHSCLLLLKGNLSSFDEIHENSYDRIVGKYPSLEKSDKQNGIWLTQFSFPYHKVFTR